MSKDFAHRLPLDRIRDGDRIDLVADEAECAAIAKRLGLASLDRLEAHAVIASKGEQVRATGRVKAALAQYCVASNEPVPERIDECFELAVVSYEAKAMKPGPEIYRYAAERAGAAPGEVFFADDRDENVEGALAAGIDAVLFTSAEQIAGELRRRGVAGA